MCCFGCSVLISYAHNKHIHRQFKLRVKIYNRNRKEQEYVKEGKNRLRSIEVNVSLLNLKKMAKKDSTRR